MGLGDLVMTSFTLWMILLEMIVWVLSSGSTQKLPYLVGNAHYGLGLGEYVVRISDNPACWAL